MDICVCDDDEIAVGMIAGAVEGSLKKRGVFANITTCRNADMLREATRTKVFDLILLDIDLSGDDGIGIAARLRESRDSTDIIFVSGCENRVFESLKVEPIGFVRKNSFMKDLGTYMDVFLRRYAARDGMTVTVTHNKSILRLAVDDIIYIEGALKKQRISVKGGGEYTLSSSMKQAERDLGPFGFIRIHSGFLVNYRYIKLIGERDVVLNDGRRLPVSRNRVKEVRERYFDLMRGGRNIEL